RSPPAWLSIVEGKVESYGSVGLGRWTAVAWATGALAPRARVAGAPGARAFDRTGVEARAARTSADGVELRQLPGTRCSLRRYTGRATRGAASHDAPPAGVRRVKIRMRSARRGSGVVVVGARAGDRPGRAGVERARFGGAVPADRGRRAGPTLEPTLRRIPA